MRSVTMQDDSSPEESPSNCFLSNLPHSAILPELQIAIRMSMRESLTILFQQIFHSGALVEEHSQVVTHDMAVLARWTLNQDSATVVALL